MYAIDNINNIAYTEGMINPTDAYTTIRIWKKTLRLLRLIAAFKEESMVAVLDSLVRQEYARLQAEEKKTPEE